MFIAHGQRPSFSVTLKGKHGFTPGTAALWVAFSLSAPGLPWVSMMGGFGWWTANSQAVEERGWTSAESLELFRPLTAPLSCSCLHMLGLVVDVSASPLDPMVGADQSQWQPLAPAPCCSWGVGLQWSSWKPVAKWALPSLQPWTLAGWQSRSSSGSSAGIAGGRREPAAGCCRSMMWVTNA